MNTRWRRCGGGGGCREWLPGHLRSTTEEGGVREREREGEGGSKGEVEGQSQ